MQKRFPSRLFTSVKNILQELPTALKCTHSISDNSDYVHHNPSQNEEDAAL